MQKLDKFVYISLSFYCFSPISNYFTYLKER